jgi:iron complex outermembrane receptor protein
MQVARGLRAAAIGGALCAAPLVAQAQTGTVTGRVVDSTSQQPLSNVTVRVEGTQLGTLTRNDGTFTIGGVPAGARTLRAARVGFSARTAPVSVAAGGSASVNLALPALAAQLTEVVAVAYAAAAGRSAATSPARWRPWTARSSTRGAWSAPRTSSRPRWPACRS